MYRLFGDYLSSAVEDPVQFFTYLSANFADSASALDFFVQQHKGNHCVELTAINNTVYKLEGITVYSGTELYLLYTINAVF